MKLFLHSNKKEIGLILLRKHAVRYLTPYRLSRKFRKELLTRQQPEEFVSLLDVIYAKADSN